MTWGRKLELEKEKTVTNSTGIVLNQGSNINHLRLKINPNSMRAGFRSISLDRANNTSLEKVPLVILRPITGKGRESPVGATILEREWPVGIGVNS